MSNKLAIVGGTGAVGRVFIEYLKTHELPIDEIKIVASSRSAGKSIHLNGSDVVVEDIENFDFSSVNFANTSHHRLALLRGRFAPIGVLARLRASLNTIAVSPSVSQISCL